MELISFWCEMETTENEQRRAAEAVVDAAICCGSARGVEVDLSEECRAALVEEILRNPELSGELFQPARLLIQ